MAKKRSSKKQFLAPIPVTLSSTVYGPLPQIYPHNPISWFCFAYKFLTLYTKPVPQSLMADIHVGLETIAEPQFTVSRRPDMDRLWDYGFFGKGTLSRSDPTWDTRTAKRLHLPHEGQFELSSEDITRFRREERVKFKSERARERQLESLKKSNKITLEEMQELQAIKSMLFEFRKNNKLKIKQEQETQIPFEQLRSEDQQVVNAETMKLTQLEKVVLQPEEVVFLKLLDVVDVDHQGEKIDIMKLFFICCQTDTPQRSNTFINQYTAYHHYKSLGWCVRSGIKFGCDYILYKRGPPFSHAEHAVLVLPADTSKSVVEMQTLSRVIGSVRKNFVLCYIEQPTQEDFEKWLQNPTLEKLLKLYRVTEIVYKRWVPNKTRD